MLNPWLVAAWWIALWTPQRVEVRRTYRRRRGIQVWRHENVIEVRFR